MYCTAGCIVGMCGCPLGMDMGMGMGWHARTHALHALISQRAVTQRGRGAEVKRHHIGEGSGPGDP